MLAENLIRIQDEMKQACRIANRPIDDVVLVCVTKSVGIDTAKELAKLGIKNIAENRVDKLLEKKDALKDFSSIKWHLIGNLQRRKVKLVINEIDYFHALDSYKLAEEIQKRTIKKLSCFIEVNVSGEESKHGIEPKEAVAFVRQLEKLDKLEIVGLMTMAPIAATKAELHELFSNLKKLQNEISNLHLKHAPCQQLSMGMSNDYSIAIEEGATFVRIGSAIFRSA